MDFMKETARQLIPASLYDFLLDGKDAMIRTIQEPMIYFHPWWRRSAQRTLTYQDRFSGKRCFVIGNGPSLQKTDLTLIKDEHTFGMNRVYLAFDNWGFQTSFLVSVNDLVVEQCSSDFQDLDLLKFFSWRSKNLLYPNGEPDQNTHFLYTTYTGETFGRRLIDRFWEGSTVTYVCLQLAYCMGFHQVILIGVDHSFQSKGKPNQMVISNGDDPNHFSPEYFGKGFRWQLPDLEMSERAYRLAQNVYQKSGRQILDATIDGNLEVFPKVDYYSLFTQG
jgi:hypothetical protein